MMMGRRFAIGLMAIAAAATAAATAPIMGWSSWNTYRVNINDSLILKQAQAIKDLGLDSLGYRYVNIDDGFFGGRDEQGNLLFHPERFPEGVAHLVEGIHALGLKAGIYSDAGANTCGNFWDNDTIARGVGLYGHEEQDARLFRDALGFDFIKVDFCGGDAFQNSDHLALDPETRYRTIRQAFGDEMAINICRWNYPGTWVADVGSSWRISQDISCNWNSIKDIIGQNLYLSAYADGAGYNDMDMLELGRGLPAEEEQTHFAIWCMMSSPLLIGCDLTQLPEETLQLISNRELIAINQDALGLQAYVADNQDGAYVLVKDIEQREGLRRAVALYNPTDSARSITLRLRDIDLGGRVELRDAIRHRHAATVTDSITVTLAPHATEVYIASAEQRLERRLYEAETAYLSSYQEIYNPLFVGSAYYKPDDEASGRMIATNIGGRPENDLVWRHVRVHEPGKRTLRLRVSSPQDGAPRRFFVSVNEGPGKLVETKTGRQEIEITAQLTEGDNSVRIYNDRELAPDIDCLEIGERQ